MPLSLERFLKHVVFRSLASGERGLRGGGPPLNEIRRFVLLQYHSALGSAVHATPLIPALRAAVPGAEIVVCASGCALEIFRNNPGVDRLVATPDPREEVLAAARAIRAALPQGPFATITSTFNERTSVALAALLAGAGNRVGYTLVPELYRVRLEHDDGLSQVANNLRIVEALGHAAAGHSEPQVFFSESDLAYARGLTGRFADGTRPLAVLVTQTSPTQRKSWRAERWVAVARWLVERHGANLVLVGSKGERPAVDALVEAIGPRAMSVAGETDLLQLAALLSLCRVGLTLDTGTLHVGRAVGLPMVIVAPAWSPVLEWLPVDDPRYVILKNLDMASAPPDYVIDEVSAEEAIAGLDRLLARAGGR